MGTLTIRARIRLAIGILGAGYVLLFLLVQWTGLKTQTCMKIVSQDLSPAIQNAQESVAALQKLTKGYSDAALTQDRGALAQGEEAALGVARALKSIAEHTGFNRTRQQQVQQLAQQFEGWHDQAKSVYGEMVANVFASAQTQAAATKLTQEQQQMEASLQELRVTLSRDSQMELESVSWWARAQRVFSGLLFLAIASAALVMAFMVERRVCDPLRDLSARFQNIAGGEGDLTQRIPVQSQDEIGELSHGFNRFIDKLQEIIRMVKTDTVQLAAASQELAASAAQMARGAKSQQNQTAQAVISVQQMAASVSEVSENSNSVAEDARRSAGDAREGGKLVENTVVMMRNVTEAVNTVAGQIARLGERSNQIGKIVSVIEEIADQTNLLALNAAIEAARAGEQGKGFAVVADEVRKLADRTGKATQEIAATIRLIQQETGEAIASVEQGTNQVQQGVTATLEAGSRLQQIIEGSERAADRIMRIAAAATQQASSTEQVSASIGEIAKISRESTAGAQEAARACEDLSNLAMELESLVARFRVEDGTPVMEAENPLAQATYV